MNIRKNIDYADLYETLDLFKIITCVLWESMINF